jgi:hypothetical protein
MHQSKLISLLKTFTKKEIKEFSSFVKSEFYNKNKQLIDFTDYICKYYPEFTAVELEKEEVFKKLFPSQKYDEPKMRYMM